MPRITDQVYKSNALFYRWDRSHKIRVQGGTQIEEPLQYRRMTSSGFYRGFDVLDTTPQDIIKNAAFDWRQAYVTVSVDGRTLMINDSPESIANLISAYFEAARAEMEEILGNALFSDAVTDPLKIDGIQGAVDNGTVASTYGGLGSRTTTNSFWQPATNGLDTSTTTLSYSAMLTVFQAVTEGARHPTILVTTRSNYNRYNLLFQPQQRFPSEPMGQDEQLASAGFTNVLFQNVPMVVDSHCNTVRSGTTGDSLYFLNEDYINFVVKDNRDIILEDFQQPVNQDAMVAKMLWMGQLVFNNVQLQGLMSALTA
jgi:hypothetical protein